ncbi:MAG: tetratricopeptide repeat protein [Bacteroidota bacterium]
MKRILLAMLLAIPIAMFAQPNPTIQAFEAEKQFQRGKQFFDNGDLRSAIQVFDQVTRLDRKHDMVYELRGEAHYALGNYDRALADYREAALQQPNNAELRNSMGVTAAKLNMYRAAIGYFQEALQIEPNHVAAQDNLNLAQQRAGALPGYQSGTIASSQKGSATGSVKTQIKSGFNNNKTGLPSTRPNARPNSGNTARPSNSNINKPRFPAVFNEDQIEIGSQSDPYLRIVKVEVTQTSTKVHFELESTSDEAFPVMLDGTKGANPFFLTDQAMRQNFKLKRIVGLPKWPNEVFMLPANRTIPFYAEFEKIRDDMTAFHLLEGKKQRKGAWDFWDIKIMD